MENIIFRLIAKNLIMIRSHYFRKLCLQQAFLLSVPQIMIIDKRRNFYSYKDGNIAEIRLAGKDAWTSKLMAHCTELEQNKISNAWARLFLVKTDLVKMGELIEAFIKVEASVKKLIKEFLKIKIM